MGTGRTYTVDETEYLKLQYLNKTDEELSEYLGRPVGSIKTKRERLGLLRFQQEVVHSIAGEIWKAIPGHPEYLVSNKGRVRNDKGLIKIFLNCNGRPHLTIRRRDRDHTSFTIHRLVAFLFCDPPPNHDELDVHHIDHNSLNNASYNLEYLTKQEHRFKHGKKS